MNHPDPKNKEEWLKWLHSEFSGRINSVYLKKKKNLDSVLYTLIRHEDEGIINECFFRAKDDGLDLSTLAREYSQGPEAATGGIVGPTRVMQAHPIIAEKLRCCQLNSDGKILTPFKVEKFWVLIRVEKYYSAKFVDFKDEIALYVGNQYLDELEKEKEPLLPKIEETVV